MRKAFLPVLSTVLALSLASAVCVDAALAKKSSTTTTTSSSTAPAKSEKSKDLSVKIVSMPSVKAGADATATVQTEADALCKITVKYKSGPATAAGLKAQHADKDGKVTWTWKVSKNTAAGDWPVEITASSKGAKGSASGTLKVEK